MEILFRNNWQLALALLTILAECLIAFVIYLELLANHTDRALDAIYDKDAYGARADLYRKFLSAKAEGEGIEQHQHRFLVEMKRDSQAIRDLDKQIAIFTKLGYMLRPRGLRRMWSVVPQRVRKGRGYGPASLIDFLPHVVSPLAVMSVAYIEMRRAEKGPRWGYHFIPLAMACLRKACEATSGMKIFGQTPDESMLLTRAHFKATMGRLERLLLEEPEVTGAV